MGTETGVRCSVGGVDRPVSSSSISPASTLEPAVGWNLTRRQEAVRVCRGDPAGAAGDHLLQSGCAELFLPHFLHLPLLPQQLQIACWEKFTKNSLVFSPRLATLVSGGSTNLRESDQSGPTGSRGYPDAGPPAPHPRTEQRERGGRMKTERSRRCESQLGVGASVAGCTSVRGMETGCTSLRVMVSGEAVRSGGRRRTKPV